MAYNVTIPSISRGDFWAKKLYNRLRKKLHNLVIANFKKINLCDTNMISQL